MLKQRAPIMFSRAPPARSSRRPSGEVGVTSAVSYQLCKDVTELMDTLPAELFDRQAEHRPCGLLCKLGAAGMLIGDVAGLPLMPWVLAEPIGKEAARRKKEIPEAKKKAKKKAKRQGADAEAAAAALLRRRVPLDLPTADEIKAAWRKIRRAEQAAARQPAPAPPAAPAAEPPSPLELESRAEQAAVKGLCPRARDLLEMSQSRAVAAAVGRAWMLAHHIINADADTFYDAELEVAQVQYKYTLRELKLAYPALASLSTSERAPPGRWWHGRCGSKLLGTQSRWRSSASACWGRWCASQMVRRAVVPVHVWVASARARRANPMPEVAEEGGMLV